MILIIIIALICLLIAHYMLQRERHRREDAHERRMERFERLMELLRKPNSDKNDEVSDTTKVEQNSKS